MRSKVNWGQSLIGFFKNILVTIFNVVHFQLNNHVRNKFMTGSLLNRNDIKVQQVHMEIMVPLMHDKLCMKNSQIWKECKLFQDTLHNFQITNRLVLVRDQCSTLMRRTFLKTKYHKFTWYDRNCFANLVEFGCYEVFW